MTRDQATALVDEALGLLIENDSDLLDLKVCERALQFRLAHYMALSEQIRPPLTVDCEYNRHRGDTKQLQLPRRPRPSSVFPDILVHQRNSDDNNVVALEIKKPTESLCNDRAKLNAFITQLGYQHAGHVIIGHDQRGTLVREVRWVPVPMPTEA